MAQSSDSGGKGFMRSGLGVKGLLKMGKRDRQVSPSPVESTRRDTLKDTRKNIEEKRAEREDKRAKKDDAKRIKDIEMQSRIARRGFRKAARLDLARTSCETFVTFILIVVVGTFLFSGGTALIVSGRENNVFDFIVVGSSGIVIGVIFTTAGIILLCKPVYENYQTRKKEYKESTKAQPPGAADMPFYFDDVQRTILTLQLGDDGRRSRRPSNVELYGDAPSGHPAAGSLDAIVIDPRSQLEPPRLAVPQAVSKKNAEQRSNQNSVFFLDAKENPNETTFVEEIVSVSDDSSGDCENTMTEEPRESRSEIDSLTHEQNFIKDSDKDKIKGKDSQLQPPLQREESDSPVVIVTHAESSNLNDKPTSGSTTQDEQNRDDNVKATPTVIIDTSSSRVQSGNTMRSKAHTPSSVVLMYDRDLVESDT